MEPNFGLRPVEEDNIKLPDGRCDDIDRENWDNFITWLDDECDFDVTWGVELTADA